MALIAFGVSLLYVLLIYIASYLTARDSWLDRDEERVLKVRLLVVLLYSMAALYSYHQWSLWNLNLYHIVQTIFALSPLLFVNCCALLGSEKPKKDAIKIMLVEARCALHSDMDALFSRDYSYMRDYIVGPFSEECVFRLTLYHALDSRCYILKSSILFSLCHLHPIFVKPKNVLPVIIQCLFTFIFGLYIGDIFQRTGSLLTCTLIHALCNRVGFVDLDQLLSLNRLQSIWFCILCGISAMALIYF